jgi:hypothetical protein
MGCEALASPAAAPAAMIARSSMRRSLRDTILSWAGPYELQLLHDCVGRGNQSIASPKCHAGVKERAMCGSNVKSERAMAKVTRCEPAARERLPTKRDL